VACDSYRQTRKDIDLLKACGARVYRFSISWSRIIPLGGRNDPINDVGVQHYVRFVDDLLAAGIEPLVTLYHWDLPAELDRRYGGLLNKDEFVLDFVNYARVMFAALGSRVKFWITFNEPWCSAILGYHSGIHAPGRTSSRETEPWTVGHNLLLAHAHAVKVFREEYKPTTGGQITITLNGNIPSAAYIESNFSY
jgi:beta-glucosidase